MTILPALERPVEPSWVPIVLPTVEEVTELDIVHEWGLGSFPASDPPANW